MKHIVQFSGGAASSYVGQLVAEREGRENTVLLFHDTKAEHEDAYRFRGEVAEYIGIEITEVSDGRSLWEVIDDNHSLPSQFIPFCTRVLKFEPGERYLSELAASGEDFVLYNGFGREEWRRIQRSMARAEGLGRVVKSPLFDLNISSEEVKKIIRTEWKICLPQPYLYLNHNNCIPCFKAVSKGYWKRIWKYYPERFKKAVEYENKIGHTVLKNISLTELQSQWGASFDMFEEEDFSDTLPCLCAI